LIELLLDAGKIGIGKASGEGEQANPAQRPLLADDVWIGKEERSPDGVFRMLLESLIGIMEGKTGFKAEKEVKLIEPVSRGC